MPIVESRPFLPVQIAILTVSDTRTFDDDRSGDTLVERAEGAGHKVIDRKILPDDPEKLVAQLQLWIADANVDVVISTGGTGVTGLPAPADKYEAAVRAQHFE